MTGLKAAGFPERAVRARARNGTAEVFPPADGYGAELYGAEAASGTDALDRARIAPPVFMPRRLEKLIELGREPGHDDVDLRTEVGGFASELPLFLSAFGSTRAGSGDLGVAASRQAARLGIPMVIGENMVPVHGYRRAGADGADGARSALLARIAAYTEAVPDGVGGVVVQQSTEDADSEVWNLVYSDPGTRPLLESGRLAFELKTGQGAKPGLGGMTVVGRAEGARLAGRFTVRDVLGGGSAADADPAGAEGAYLLRCATPGTFTEEIVRQQLRFMRNNFPKARTWVKFHPGRDVAQAAATAWRAGADAVTVDGAEGGTGWAPRVFLDQVGLGLADCLRLIAARTAGAGADRPDAAVDCLLATGRMWEGGRAVRALALGARAVGLGRAALIAVDEDPQEGLVRLAGALALEARLLISALGKYTADALDAEDLWWPGGGRTPVGAGTPAAVPGALS
ncbi:glutamate synthase [Streptomyces bambusae]|uniref:glutamate synthase-related protein n=1 Tax=Streptomyces bambusae TaxID=1550616 RepID=UPI001CFD492F|nr:glutamate synthase-related protein [Streptomyces bambusae]MCB5163543.1 glutamate synthase [Streptomyces bambusae]